jgi:hypothetical protein
MPQMSAYCKAVLAEDVRKFPNWKEDASPMRMAAEEVDGESHPETEYFFVHDDYVVTSGVYRDEEIAFAAGGEDWRQFCRDVLGVHPEDATDEDEKPAAESPAT